jgi:phosphohistidine phosphatase SixA
MMNPIIQLEEYLKEVNYPADKQDIIDYARKQGADENVVIVLNHLPDVQYKTFQEAIDIISKPQ